MASRPKRPRDPNQLAKLIVDLSTGGSGRTAGRRIKKPKKRKATAKK